MLPATSSSPRPCALVAERPANGLHQWLLLALHFRRRSCAAPRRRGSSRGGALTACPLHSAGGCPGGRQQGLPLPVPLLAPLLALLGSWLLCFPALLFFVSLRLPVFSSVPFLVSDLACLVCTVQIKLSLLLFAYMQTAQGSAAVETQRRC